MLSSDLDNKVLNFSLLVNCCLSLIQIFQYLTYFILLYYIVRFFASSPTQFLHDFYLRKNLYCQEMFQLIIGWNMLCNFNIKVVVTNCIPNKLPLLKTFSWWSYRCNRCTSMSFVWVYVSERLLWLSLSPSLMIL